MKVGHSRREIGQGCIEFIVGLAIIVIVILAIIWAISELTILIKRNVQEIRSTATPVAVSTTPHLLQNDNENIGTISPEDNSTVLATATPNTTNTTEEPADATTSPVPPKKSTWERFVDWVKQIFTNPRSP
ncbi:MAG: hypothetical protein HY867_19275 [Chloroflexi bacterium]|nr:hypothetical protein [Chloroflexota bacterium]